MRLLVPGTRRSVELGRFTDRIPSVHRRTLTAMPVLKKSIESLVVWNGALSA